jgi:hypothetical protein
MPMGRRGGGSVGWVDLALALLGVAALAGARLRRRRG